MITEYMERNLPPKPNGPRGIGNGAIDNDKSRSRSLPLSVSGGLFLVDFSSSLISSMGG